MEERIQKLEDTIKKMEARLPVDSAEFEQMIRDMVFYDQDATTATGSGTSVVTGVNFALQTVTTANLVTKPIEKFVRIYFRGQAYNVPVYTITS